MGKSVPVPNCEAIPRCLVDDRQGGVASQYIDVKLRCILYVGEPIESKKIYFIYLFFYS